ncbi:hypothetical protein EIN_145680 [Entamoeba invadens IP1]|uniref:Uncharacterized protein n=1 Tax=Entamoeba invadens IP1 TaxID=370355 RepID=L7FN62_ENTIV|nr:hypothetical protein EIN_145680 [Entamoeba invadens IP1]ELP87594.1 hypothetical protein EIN_145680 [Entamoeba invadens IP1]|eukprot:XP_004254365.1 hypothetical protein EIN_145680 [Entamoeba invadens IP1]
METLSHVSENIKCINERTQLSYLQCSLLAFISMNRRVVVGHLKKPSKYSNKFIEIQKVFFDNDEYSFVFNVQSFLAKRAQERMSSYNKKNSSGKWALRKVRSQKKRECIHLLEDILFEDGFVVMYDTENREGIGGNIFIILPDGSVMDKVMIKRLGQTIWNYCEVEKKDTKEIILNNGVVMTLLSREITN